MGQQRRHEGYESPVDRAIREAQERGDFDNLPGAGKPLDLRDAGDPDWWVKRYAAREQLDLGGALPGALGLRKEAAGYPESLADVTNERTVRAVLEDYNTRVLADRLRPAVGSLPPLLAKTIDVDDMVRRWRELRETRAAAVPVDPPPTPAAPRTPWWRRPFSRGRGGSRPH
jgi:hypothetical protein